LEKENIRKREMRVIDKEKEYKTEAKQLRRKLEALNKLRAMNTVPDSDSSESSEDEKAKQKRMKAKEKEKEKADAAKKMVRFGASSSDSEESEDEQAERKKAKAKKKEETIMAKKTEVSSSDSSS
jgi:hypothetical protein